ncbi:MAG: type II toxin-antitoxin system VapC family toxin [Betaproteobacteria bacterium]
MLDCSVALAWLLPGERTAALDVLGDSLLETSAVVPAIWPYEVSNALRMAERRGRVAETDIADLVRALAALPIEVEPVAAEHVLTTVIELAHTLDLTTYDAAYIELARRRAMPLATLDERLRRACALVRVTVLP